MLIDKGHFIISNSATPTQAEIDGQFSCSKLTSTWESLADENSGRDDTGYMHINWLYQRIRKIGVTMPPSTSEQINKLLSLVQGRTYFITYWDALSNKERTSEVYTANSSAEMYSAVIKDGLWQDVTFNAIELGGENSEYSPEEGIIIADGEYIVVHVGE